MCHGKELSAGTSNTGSIPCRPQVSRVTPTLMAAGGCYLSREMTRRQGKKSRTSSIGSGSWPSISETSRWAADSSNFRAVRSPGSTWFSSHEGEVNQRIARLSDRGLRRLCRQLAVSAATSGMRHVERGHARCGLAHAHPRRVSRNTGSVSDTVLTELMRSMTEDESRAAIEAASRVSDGLKNTQQGAARSVWCATSPQLDGMGAVYCEDVDIAEAVSADAPGPRGVRPWASDPELAERLWTLSEGWTGVGPAVG